MPVIRDIALRLKAGEVWRREGIGGHSKIRPEIKSITLELLADVKKARLLEPAMAYEIYPINGMSHGQLSLERETLSGLVTSTLPGARELAVVVGTIGPGLEKQVTDYNSRGEPLRALLLDGIGSAAVDSLSRTACQLITAEAASRNYQASSPISPGMPGLPITGQRTWLEMVPAREIGVSLTSSGMMSPRKSTSMVIGIGPDMPRWTRAEACARCNLSQTCQYRISTSKAITGR